MSWKLGKKSPKSTKTDSLSAGGDGDSMRSTTPTPGNPRGGGGGGSQLQPGLLTIRVSSAEGLAVSSVPPAVQSALSSSEAQIAASVSPSSVTQQRLANGRNNRDSMQRVQCWWLPYIVLEFDVNQVLITPLGGDLSSPVYMFQAHLYVYVCMSINSVVMLNALQ